MPHELYAHRQSPISTASFFDNDQTFLERISAAAKNLDIRKTEKRSNENIKLHNSFLDILNDNGIGFVTHSVPYNSINRDERMQLLETLNRDGQAAFSYVDQSSIQLIIIPPTNTTSFAIYSDEDNELILTSSENLFNGTFTTDIRLSHRSRLNILTDNHIAYSTYTTKYQSTDDVRLIAEVKEKNRHGSAAFYRWNNGGIQIVEIKPTRTERFEISSDADKMTLKVKHIEPIFDETIKPELGKILKELKKMMPTFKDDDNALLTFLMECTKKSTFFKTNFEYLTNLHFFTRMNNHGRLHIKYRSTQTLEDAEFSINNYPLLAYMPELIKEISENPHANRDKIKVFLDEAHDLCKKYSRQVTQWMVLAIDASADQSEEIFFGEPATFGIEEIDEVTEAPSMDDFITCLSTRLGIR